MKKIDFSQWDHLIDLSEIPLPGQRIRKVLVREQDFEVILNFWGEGCASALHGHGGSNCSFKVLSGEITEKQFSPFSTHLIETKHMLTGDQSSIRDSDAFHSLHAKTVAVSMHYYDRPLQKIQVLTSAETWELQTL